MRGSAVACANIALAKYWGKSDTALNLPAVPSLSLTLGELTTETSVVFDSAFERDELVLNGHVANHVALRRAIALLDRLRSRAKITLKARIESTNNFPTASGLASSASGFAALAGAASTALELALPPNELSALARASSASAARSVFGGFVELLAGQPGEADLSAQPLFNEAHWKVCMVVAVTAEHEKDVGSTSGMESSRATSPYYGAWLKTAPALFSRVRDGVAARDIERTGEAMEESMWAMHACALASTPSIRYWQSATANALDTVQRLRKEKSLPVYATMDAGPHVKAFCRSEDARTVSEELAATPGVLRTLLASPGPGIRVST